MPQSSDSAVVAVSKTGAYRRRMHATGHVEIPATVRVEAVSVLNRIQRRTGLPTRTIIDRLLRHPDARTMIETQEV